MYVGKQKSPSHLNENRKAWVRSEVSLVLPSDGVCAVELVNSMGNGCRRIRKFGSIGGPISRLPHRHCAPGDTQGGKMSRLDKNVAFRQFKRLADQLWHLREFVEDSIMLEELSQKA